MTGNEYVISARIENGEPLIDNRCVALLLGVTPEEVKALPIVDGRTTLPKKWVQQGRRRAKEAKRWGNGDDILDSLRYWARKDYNAELKVVYQ